MPTPSDQNTTADLRKARTPPPTSSTAVLVDYLPYKALSGDVSRPGSMAACLAALQRLAPLGERFRPLRIALLSEGNYLLVNLALCAKGARASLDAALVSYDAMYLLISFRKSTPPQNRQLIFTIANESIHLTVVWGSGLSRTSS